MAGDIKRVKVGDKLTTAIINAIIDELNRWRRTRGAGTIDVDNADGTLPPTIIGHVSQDRYRIWLPTGIAAGTFGTPATKTDVILAVRSGDGWTTSGGVTITLFNCDTTPITGAKAGWAFLREGNSFELAIGDC